MLQVNLFHSYSSQGLRKSFSYSVKTFLIFVCTCIFLFSNSAYALNSIVAVDKDGTVGQYTSLVLDSQGYPTISYYDATEAKLKVVHCFEKNCALLNTIVTPDASFKVGQYTAIA